MAEQLLLPLDYLLPTFLERAAVRADRRQGRLFREVIAFDWSVRIGALLVLVARLGVPAVLPTFRALLIMLRLRTFLR